MHFVFKKIAPKFWHSALVTTGLRANNLMIPHQKALTALQRVGREGFITGIENDAFSSNQPPLVPPLCYCLRLCMQLDAIFIGTAKRRCRDCILFLNNNGRRRYGNSWLMQLDVESRSVTATLQGSNADFL